MPRKERPAPPGEESLESLLLEPVRSSRRYHGLPEEPSAEQAEAVKQ
jgi:hypothetical protein